MAGTEISIYSSVEKHKNPKKIPLEVFFENIRNGHWQDAVNKVRVIEDKKQRDAQKKLSPCVNISGLFKERTDAGLEAHSGYIAIDIDDENVEAVREKIKNDKYLCAGFTSISGRGFCAVFKINPDKHREAFQGLSEYLFNTYRIICDPTSINVSRARFVSFDPYIITKHGEKFTQYPKTQPPKKIDKVIFNGSDFEHILEQVVQRRLNLCENYHDWLRIGFAVADKFGEEGRQYFHILSQYSSKYDSRLCDKQYDAIVKREQSGVHISTFYYYAKQAGIEVYTQRTRTIAYTAQQAKENGLSQEQVVKNLEEFEQITGSDVADIVKQVIENKIHINEDTLIDQLELWLRQNYRLRRNCITRYIENDGVIVQQKDLNTIYIRAKKLFDKLSYELIDRLINSNFIPTYNPFEEWFAAHTWDGKDHITALFSTITTPNSQYLLHFGTKWLVGMISSIHGKHSPLMLVLSGDKQNTGKTEFFRRILPDELMAYYAESKLDAGKDDEILMTQKLLIMDDEMGGKSKKENKKLKDLTSKQVFSLREPYGRNNVDLLRLAVLGGTTNDNEIYSDFTNRRLIGVHVDAINHEAYNTVDKAQLLMQAYELWKTGYVWQLNSDDIQYLKDNGQTFQVSSLEAELILKYFSHGNTVQLTASEVKSIIEHKSGQMLSLWAVGANLKALGFTQLHIKLRGGSTKRVYQLSEGAQGEDNLDGDNVPF